MREYSVAENPATRVRLVRQEGSDQFVLDPILF